MVDDTPADRMLDAEDAQAAIQRSVFFHDLGTIAAAERDEALQRVRELEAALRDAMTWMDVWNEDGEKARERGQELLGDPYA